MEHKSKPNQTSAARRRLLKSAAVGGGIVAGSRALPDSWAKPIMASVMTPAHAQTSAPFTGIYTAAELEGGPLAMFDAVRNGPQYAILHALIPSAQASLAAGNDFCADQQDSGPITTFNLIIRINNDQTVDIAIDGGFLTDGPGDSSVDIICSGDSTIDVSNNIADASVNIGTEFFGDPDCFIDLTNMVATATEVTGSWSFSVGGPSDNEPVNCFGDFTAPLGGTFPAAESCAGAEITVGPF